MRRPDPRDSEPRDRDVERADLNRGGRVGDAPRDRASRTRDPRDVFTRDLQWPRGPDREAVLVRDRTYHLRGSESRTLATVGAFRVVHADDLRDRASQLATRDADLRHLRAEGLVDSVRLEGDRRPVVTLTERGRELLEAHRSRGGGREQTFYAGVRKTREVEHDAALYRAYQKSADRLQDDGVEIHRVVLDYELKREYQEFLQELNRDRADSDGRPRRDEEEIQDWARLHDLPYFDDQVHFPDLRIEYEREDGRTRYEDIEVLTQHYRGSHAAASAKAGFTRYRMASARIGGLGGGGSRGGRGARGARLAEELL